MSSVEVLGAVGEQTRARYPDVEGFVERDGLRVFYEVYGEGALGVLLLPTWELVHSRAWKCQIPYFARHGRVATFDRLGNGRSDRPEEVRAYDRRASVDDALAVLEKAGLEQAVVVSWCGAGDDLILAALHPDRIRGLVLIGPDLMLTDDPAEEQGYSFDEDVETPERWEKWNRHYWLRDWPGFLEFFFGETFTEPHSTKQIEDAIGWGLQTDPRTISRGMDAEWPNDRETASRLCSQVPCPTMVIQGSEDAVVGRARGAAVANAIPHAQLVTLDGCGHAPHLRKPVVTNLVHPRLLRGRSWTAAHATRSGRVSPRRRPRALYVSSPIGLGHARRDVAIARELRRLHPDLVIDWLAQDPSPACWRPRASISTPPARIWPANRGISSPSRPSTTSTAFRRCGAWTRSSRRTSCCFTMSCANSATTCGSATRRGSWTTTCTRTRARSEPRSRG